jgi:phosphotriesterase-related protein
MIQTVSGEISPEELGVTSMHEHIPIDRDGAHRADAIDFAINELRAARDLGLQTVVEVSPDRDVEGIKRVADKANVQVIVCTGFYTYDDSTRLYDEDRFYGHMMNEITNGIGGTNLRPGVIKIATHNSMLEEHEVQALRAAGRVQAETGLPLCVHSVTGCAAQQKVLDEAGANLEKVYFSHVEAVFGWEGRSLPEEIEILIDVVFRGSVLCYNNFGNIAHTSHADLVAIVLALIQNGYTDHQVATMDTVWSYPDGVRKLLWEEINPDGKERTYKYLLSGAIPDLETAGISKVDTRRMVVDTPRRIFGG